MVNNNNETRGLDDMRKGIDKIINDFNKTMYPNINKLGDIVKNVGYKAQKKGKVNKKNAIMYLAEDDSHVKIEYEDKNDNIKFFEGFK